MAAFGDFYNERTFPIYRMALLHSSHGQLDIEKQKRNSLRALVHQCQCRQHAGRLNRGSNNRYTGLQLGMADAYRCSSGAFYMLNSLGFLETLSGKGGMCYQ